MCCKFVKISIMYFVCDLILLNIAELIYQFHYWLNSYLSSIIKHAHKIKTSSSSNTKD
eukprot:c41012_g1_i1 orf=2-172(-)